MKFSPICGHVTPLNGGTKAQSGEASFHPGCPVVRCQHCRQLIPIATAKPLRYPPIDPQLSSTYHHFGSFNSLESLICIAEYIDTDRPDSFEDFKAATFQNALVAAQKGGRSSNPIATVATGSGRPTTASHSQQYLRTRNPNQKGKKAATLGQPIENQDSFNLPLPLIRKYNLKLIISHVDTPFRLEVIPDSEEWCPTEEDIGQDIHGMFLTTCFMNIIEQTGLWESLPIMIPDCTS